MANMAKKEEFKKAKQALEGLVSAYNTGAEFECESTLFVGRTVLDVYIYTSSEEGVKRTFEVTISDLDGKSVPVRFHFKEKVEVEKIMEAVKIREEI